MTEGPAVDSSPPMPIVDKAASTDGPSPRRYLEWMFLYALLVGISAALRPETNLFHDMLLVPCLLLTFAWCLADARERGRPIGRTNRVLLLIFFAVGFPLYILRSRGWAAPWTFGKIAVVGVLLAALMIVPQYVVIWAAHRVHGG